MERDEKIAFEALALWWILFGEPPIVGADGGEIISAMVRSAQIKPYDFKLGENPVQPG
jgi:hypothetical protein